MLSPAVRQRLEAARQLQAHYRPNDEVCALLADKTLVMCVGPTAIGKSFIMNKAVELDDEFQRVSVFTTREPREDDEPGMFQPLMHDDENVWALLDQMERGELVNFAIHPNTGRIYGTTPEDYSAKYNLLATLSGAVAQLQALPFASTHLIGLGSHDWRQWMLERYPEDSSERQKRLREAISSLEWLLKTPGVTWLENPAGQGKQTAQQLINIVKYNEAGDTSAREIAERMLMTAKEMI